MGWIGTRVFTKQNRKRLHLFYKILYALNSIHRNGIIHRDLKPGNLIFDTKNLNLYLIDFGEFYMPNVSKSLSVSTLYYKPPEILVGYMYYDYAFDLWSTGTIFASLIFNKKRFFDGENNTDIVTRIMDVLGYDNLESYIRKLRVQVHGDFPQDYGSLHVGNTSGVGLKYFKGNDTPLATDLALDLLEKLLVYDHDRRITANEAMQHAFFNDVRNEINFIQDFGALHVPEIVTEEQL